MSPKTLAIVDYGSGNLRSAAKAFERAARDSARDTKIVVTHDPEAVKQADRIVLPGVGAFPDCRAGLKNLKGMEEALVERVIRQGTPFLGICVGMQLLASVGHEYGETRGLNWIAGDIFEMRPQDERLKIPHMGWNSLSIRQALHPLLEGIAEGAHLYFLHSFHFLAKDAAHVLAEVNYGGSITAMVGRDNIAGTQFHPEKSQKAGLKLFENFLGWQP